MSSFPCRSQSPTLSHLDLQERAPLIWSVSQAEWNHHFNLHSIHLDQLGPGEVKATVGLSSELVWLSKGIIDHLQWRSDLETISCHGVGYYRDARFGCPIHLNSWHPRHAMCTEISTKVSSVVFQLQPEWSTMRWLLKKGCPLVRSISMNCWELYGLFCVHSTMAWAYLLSWNKSL